MEITLNKIFWERLPSLPALPASLANNDVLYELFSVHKITTVRTIHLQDNNFARNISRSCAQNYGRKTGGDLSIDGKIMIMR